LVIMTAEKSTTNPVHRMNAIKTTDTLSRYISHVAAGKTIRERPSRLPYVILKKSRKWKSFASFNNQRLEHCTRVSQMKTLNIFYLIIYWTQKVHNDFIFLCSLHCIPYKCSSASEVHAYL
jgi:hypothetical protein